MSDPKLRPGTNFCKCGACGRYFGSVTTFDQHRRGEHPNRRCVNPAEIVNKDGEPQLRLNDKGYWVGARRRIMA